MQKINNNFNIFGMSEWKKSKIKQEEQDWKEFLEIGKIVGWSLLAFPFLFAVLWFAMLVLG